MPVGIPGQGDWHALPNVPKGGELGAENPTPKPSPVPSTVPVHVPPPDAGNGYVDTVLHVVQKNESFWTISRLYYNSGRFYRALWAANKDQAPTPTDLWVGMTIKVPPLEALDRSLIEAPGAYRTATATPETVPVRRSSRPILSLEGTGSNTRVTGTELALPVSDTARAGDRGDDSVPWNDAVPDYPTRRTRSDLPVYRVREYETVRSIARDRLGDSRRANEILELNEGIIDDPRNLIPGQLLRLPEDARPVRRTRSGR